MSPFYLYTMTEQWWIAQDSKRSRCAGKVLLILRMQAISHGFSSGFIFLSFSPGFVIHRHSVMFLNRPCVSVSDPDPGRVQGVYTSPWSLSTAQKPRITSGRSPRPLYFGRWSRGNPNFGDGMSRMGVAAL